MRVQGLLTYDRKPISISGCPVTNATVWADFVAGNMSSAHPFYNVTTEL